MPRSPGTGESGVSPILALSRTHLSLFQQAAREKLHTYSLQRRSEDTLDAVFVNVARKSPESRHE